MKNRLLLLLVTLAIPLQMVRADIVTEEFVPVFHTNTGDKQTAGFRLHVTNTGAPLRHVTAIVNSNDSNIEIQSGKLQFGTLGALATQSSKNVFVVIASNAAPLDDEALKSAIGLDYHFRFDMTLTAQVIDEPIPNAVVTANVGGTETTTTADADGNFIIDLTLINFDEFVTLDAVGGLGQEFVALRSLVGSGLDLHTATETVDGSSVLSTDELQALDVTHVTTAKAILAERANGGPITTAGELVAAELTLDTAELIRLAVTIKAVIDNPMVSLPAGFATTLELAMDPVASAAFSADLKLNYSSEFYAAMAETLAGTASGGFVASDLAEPVYSNILRNLGVIIGEQLVFNADGSAQHTSAEGTVDATWSIDPDGVLELTPPAPVFRWEVFGYECWPKIETAVRTEQFYLGSRFQLVLRGAIVDMVTANHSYFSRFPDNPECPPTDPYSAGYSGPFRWIGESGTRDYTAADFSGKEVVLNFWSTTETRPPVGNAVRNSGQDIFSFNSDGTGSTRITARDFLWEIDPDGHLEIEMTTGEINEYVSLGQDIDGDVDSAINIGTTSNGKFAYRSLQLEVDPAFTLSPANFVGPIFLRGRDEQNTHNPGSVAEFEFLADRSWVINGVLPYGIPSTLWSNPNGRLVYEFTYPGYVFQEISWTPVAIIGDRYWVLDARQLGWYIDPALFVDLATTTGHLTYYRAVP